MDQILNGGTAMNWQAFWAMGGYGYYVWSAYGFAALVLAFNLLVPIGSLS